MDESIAKAKLINQDLKRRAIKAMKIQRERALGRRFATHDSVEGHNTSYLRTQSFSSKDRTMTDFNKTAQLVSEQLENYKKVKKVEKSKQEFMRKKKKQNLNKQEHAQRYV